MFGDMRTEDERITEAIAIAITEIKRDKEADQDPETATEAEQISTKDKKKKLGVSNLFKLPYVIGTKEFAKHPYAGLVYLNLDDTIEQQDLHIEEVKQV